MAALTPGDLGVPETQGSALPVEHAARVAAALDHPAGPAAGDPLPLLWHWAFFTPAAPTSALGRDGHPQIAADGPTAGLPRRMFAGGRLRRLGPLVVGREAERRARIVSCEPKAGRSGRLVVVTVGYAVRQDGRVVVEEEQDLIYREPGDPLPLPEGAHRAPAPPGGWVETVRLDPVTLFRFSAVTFNAHRIHYDATYARDVEGYPRLVVHGPLVALLLAASARDHLDADLETFTFRATAPLFEGLEFSLVGAVEGGRARLRAVRNDGQVAMEATAG